jgi:hypothetical protein
MKHMSSIPDLGYSLADGQALHRWIVLYSIKFQKKIIFTGVTHLCKPWCGANYAAVYERLHEL